jgi:hypothetical protein
MPNPEPIGLPAPAWLLQVLLVLTFTLHLIPMSLTVGGSLVAVWHEVRGRALPDSHHRQLAARLWKMLPIITAFTITLGVAPLLFIQLLYGKFFYPASVLTGWSWFAVVPLLIVGYGALYLQAMGPGEARWRPWAGAAAVLAFLAVAAIYVSTMSLSTAPDMWKQLYAQSQGGTHFHFQLPRWLHVATGAVAMTGALVALLGHIEAHDEAFGRFARRTGLTWLGVGLLLGAPAAAWYLFQMPIATAASVRGWLLYTPVALSALSFILLALADSERNLLMGWAGMGSLTLAAALLAIQRHLVRQGLLQPYINAAADWKLQSQWDAFTLFALVLVGSLALIGYMVVRFRRAAQASHTPAKGEKAAS